jgi:exodeoxyribonuclease VII large subunit
MRGRHAAELTHTAARLMRARIAARDRRLQQLERQLALFDVSRRLAGVRAKLVSAEGRLTATIAGRHGRASARLMNCAGQLNSLSPLAVLARGYAVCWTVDRSHIVRAAADVETGDRVKVTLASGELTCEVQATTASADRAEKNGERG